MQTKTLHGRGERIIRCRARTSPTRPHLVDPHATRRPARNSTTPSQLADPLAPRRPARAGPGSVLIRRVPAAGLRRMEKKKHALAAACARSRPTVGRKRRLAPTGCGGGGGVQAPRLFRRATVSIFVWKRSSAVLSRRYPAIYTTPVEVVPASRRNHIAV